jgi:hypothetical protein
MQITGYKHIKLFFLSRKLTIFLFCLAIYGCENYFEPDIDNQPSFYVVSGIITNQKGPHVVKITKSLNFNDVTTYEGVPGAQVEIEIKDGEHVTLLGDTIGNYISDSTFQGIVNKEYRIHIVTADNKEFYSQYVTLLPSAPIDTLTGQYKKTVVSTTDALGNYLEETIDGIQSFNSTLCQGYTPFYRYKCNLIFQSQQKYPSVGFIPELNLYITRPGSSYGNLFIANGNNYSRANIIDNPLYFARRSILEFELYDIQGEREYDVYQRGVLIDAKQYSLDQDGYNFWKAISDQQKASDYLFDPVEAQVHGNIYCTSNPDEIVFGYFGASGVSEKKIAFQLTKWNEIVVRSVKYFPILDSTMIDSIAPDYFIDFFGND